MFHEGQKFNYCMQFRYEKSRSLTEMVWIWHESSFLHLFPRQIAMWCICNEFFFSLSHKHADICMLLELKKKLLLLPPSQNGLQSSSNGPTDFRERARLNSQRNNGMTHPKREREREREREDNLEYPWVSRTSSGLFLRSTFLAHSSESPILDIKPYALERGREKKEYKGDKSICWRSRIFFFFE